MVPIKWLWSHIVLKEKSVLVDLKQKNSSGIRLNYLSQCILVSLIAGVSTSQIYAADNQENPAAEDVVKLNKVIAKAKPKPKAKAEKKVQAGTLGTVSELETPFSIKRVDSKAIEENQAKSLAKLFESEAGVETKGSTYSINSHAVSVRGLQLDFTNGFKIDGHPFQMYGVELPLELFDEVQLLKGSTGFMYGIGSPGGLINYVTKKPNATQTLSASVGYSSDSIFSQHVDVGGRFGEEDRYGYRFNVINEEGETYNGTDIERQAVSLGLDAEITPNVKLRANGLYQERKLDGGINSIIVTRTGANAYVGNELPSPISGRKDLTAYDGLPYYDSKVWAASTGISWDLNENWNVDASYSHTYKQIDTRDENLYLRNIQGDYGVAIRQLYMPTLEFDSIQLRLSGDLETGWLKHKLIFGVDRQTQTRDLNIGNPALNPDTSTGGQNHLYPGTGPYPQGNLYQNSLDLAYGGYSPRKFFKISDWETRSAYISDKLSFNDQWSLLLGLRKFDYENNNYFVSGKLRNRYREKPFTPTAALLYTPNKNTTFYGSYVEALEDGGTVGNTYVNANDQLSPITSKQYELGVKTENNTWGVSSAIFRIEKGQGYATAQNYYSDDGLVRYDGIEFAGTYKPVKDLTLSASSSFIDAEYKKGQPAVLGNEPSAVAKFQGNLGAAYDIAAIEGLKVHGNFNYIGSQYLNTANDLKAPSYELLSLGTSYKTSWGDHQLTYRAELNNIFDKEYWIATNDGVVVGAPRTLNLNVKFDF